jgi:hypothetical protein
VVRLVRLVRVVVPPENGGRIEPYTIVIMAQTLHRYFRKLTRVAVTIITSQCSVNLLTLKLKMSIEFRRGNTGPNNNNNKHEGQ